MSFQLLAEEIERGLIGLNEGIPMGFDRLSRYVGIRKKILTLIFGAAGSGKSAFVHSAYILNPYDYYAQHRDIVKFKVILFAMERSKIYILAKWMTRKILLDQGILIPLGTLLGWKDFAKLTKDEHDLVLMYGDYMNELLEVVDIIEGAQNPTGIYKYVKKYATENGKFEDVDEFTRVYIPNHSNEIIIPIEDHLGNTKTEKGYSTKKEAIDKVSEYNQWFRDILGYSPVTVSQLTRGLNNPIYQKSSSFEPSIDDVKESGRPGEDADNVISLFDPLRYRTHDGSYGDVSKFVSPTGGKFFRSIKVLKNTYGEDDIRIGMAFHGAVGVFKELPKASQMGSFDVESLFNSSYFL